MKTNRQFAALTVLKNQVRINNILAKAKRKGITVRRNIWTTGWSIGLPNGGTYHAKTTDDMIDYVNHY